MGLTDFVKHIYHYFAPDEHIPITSQHQAERAINAPTYIPVYDATGHLVRYIEGPMPMVGKKEEAKRVDLVVAKSKPTAPNQPHAPVLCVLTEDGRYIPVPPLEEKIVPVPPAPVPLVITPNKTNSGIEMWDGWPDGPFEQDFTKLEYTQTGKLRVHWAVKANGGYPNNKDPKATEWQTGLKIRRVCLGVIECDNPTCQILTRPKVKPELMEEQLKKPCQCGGTLFQEKCGAVSFLFQWSGGYHYSQTDYHLHRRPSHLLHLLPPEKRQFEDLVKAHPKSGPLQLIVGVPQLEGPGKSVADISDVLLNAHRVGKERQKIIHGLNTQTGDGLIALFAEFDRKHPGFMRRNNVGVETVVSVQSNFMRSQLVKKERLDGPINGLVNDAAHGFWAERNSLLMVTSTYCPVLLCWVPGVISYTNGASADHFQHHFIAVLESICQEAQAQNIQITDDLFAGVMDFSEAERKGFVRAFVTVKRDLGDPRTPQELQVAGERLLKGCREHYRAGVTRVSRMNAAVPPDATEQFKRRALDLLELPSSDVFITQAALIVQDFPKLHDWMKWWMRPAHAQMLFESERKMDIELWKSIPETTNAEESMHWKLYSACGRDHRFLEGMHSLYGIAVYYERLYEGAMKGAPTRYGKAEPWKDTAEKLGHSKLTRADQPENKKRKKNDGRPPDTVQELIKSKKRPRKTEANEVTILTFGPQSYPWNSNSCWLDSALQMLYICLSVFFDELSPVFALLPMDSGLRHVYNHLLARHSLELDTNISQTLAHQREEIRAMLLRKKVIDSIDSFGTFYAWFTELVRQEGLENYRPLALFNLLFVEIHKCSGCESTGGPHVEITNPPAQRRLFQVNADDHKTFKGKFSDYFHALISLNKKPLDNLGCWRSHDGSRLCSGSRSDTRNLVASLPMVFAVEVSNERIVNQDFDIPLLVWDFPAMLFPETKKAATSSGLVYDLMGYGLTNVDGNHFMARFASRNKKEIYTYDGMKHQGLSVQEPNAKFATHMTGSNIRIPEGTVIYQAFYVLRGGLQAQELFYTHRTSALSKKFKLSFSSGLSKLPSISYKVPGLVNMAPKDRFWLLNPHKIKYTEYISTKAPKQTVRLITPEPKSEDDELELEDNSDIPDNKEIPESVPVNLPMPLVPSISEAPAVELDSYPVDSYNLCDTCANAKLDNNHPFSSIMVTCTLCQRKWHEDCVSIGSSNAALDLDDTWACPACVNPHKGQWDEAMVGVYILLRPTPSARFYPAKVLGRSSTHSVHVEWYAGNIYHPHDQPPSSRSLFTPLECLQAKNRDSLFAYTKENLGTIKWPVRLEEDAVEKHEYQNEAIRKNLEGSYGAILEIMRGERDHPIIELYLNWIKHRPRSSKMISLHQFAFTEQFEPGVLPADNSLIDSFLAHLTRDTKNSKVLVEHHWISNVASVLFRLAILRGYLGRQPCDDEQIFYLAYTGTSYSNLSPDDPHADAKKGSIKRFLTPAEQVASALKDIDSIRIRGLSFGRVIDHHDYFPGVQLAGALAQSGEPYSFFNTTASGMAGGPNFVSNWRIESTLTVKPGLNGNPKARPKPRPRGQAKADILQEEYRVIKPAPTVPVSKRMRGAENSIGIELRRSKRRRVI